MAQKIATLFGYIGSGWMIAFSFTLNIEYAIFGLLCLTIQALQLRAFNLVALNIISLIGFFIQFFS